MRVPSADHRAEEPLTSERSRLPSAFMIHSEDSHLSLILSTQRRVKTICLPSGEICGSATSSNSRYRSRLSLRLCACALASAGTSSTNTMRQNKTLHRIVLLLPRNEGFRGHPKKDGTYPSERTEHPHDACAQPAPGAAQHLRPGGRFPLGQIRVSHRNNQQRQQQTKCL